MTVDCVAVPDYFLDSHLVRAASLLSKPLPMEQFQVIQGFISRVPQGKKMVEEEKKKQRKEEGKPDQPGVDQHSLSGQDEP